MFKRVLSYFLWRINCLKVFIFNTSCLISDLDDVDDVDDDDSFEDDGVGGDVAKDVAILVLIKLHKSL